MSEPGFRPLSSSQDVAAASKSRGTLRSGRQIQCQTLVGGATNWR